MSSKRGPRPPSTEYVAKPRPPSSPPTPAEVRHKPRPPNASGRSSPPKPRRGPRPPSDDFDQAYSDPRGAPPKPRGGPRPPSSEYGQSKKIDYDPSEPYMKSNDYKGERMSFVLRGGEVEDLDLDHYLYDSEHEELENEDPQTFLERMNLIYRKKIHEKKALPRAFLCFIAVSLLWVSSAAACRGLITTLVQTPSFNDLQTSVFTLRNVTNDESENYEACVVSIADECTSRHSRGLQGEIERITTLQNNNEANLNAGTDIRNNCGTLNDQLTVVLTSASEVNVLPSGFPKNGAPFEPCNIVDDIAGEGIVARQAVILADESAAEGKEVVANYNDSLAERQRVGQENSQAVSDSVSSSSAEDRDALLTDTDAQLGNPVLQSKACLDDREVFDAAGTRVICPADSYSQRIEDQTKALEEEYAKLEDQGEALIAQVERMKEIIEKIPPIPGIPLPDIPFPSLGEFSAAIGIELEAPFDFDSFDEAQAALQAAYEEKLAENEAKLNETIAAIERGDTEFAESIVNEYDPPTDPTLQARIDNYNSEADTLGAEVAENVGFVSDTGEPVPPVDIITSRAEETAARLIPGSGSRAVAEFFFPGEFFENFTLDFKAALDLFVALDIVWRVLQSILLIKKYWSISGVATPPGIVRSDKGALFKEKRSILQVISSILAHPLLQLAYMGIWIGAITALIYVAYSPIYNEFVKGCVDSSLDDIDSGLETGTMLFRNIQTTISASAVTDGDNAITERIDQFNLGSTIDCRDNFVASVETREIQNNTFQDLNFEHEQLKEKFNAFFECVNWDEFQTQASNSGVDIDFRIQTIVDTEECRGDIPGVDVSAAAEFSCEELVICRLDGRCPGVDERDIRQVSHRNACFLEFGIHTYFFVSLFTSAMYVCVNLSRFYLMRGIIGVFYRQITLDLYSYMASCTERGKIIPPEEVEDGEPFHKVIKRALDKALRKFWLNGLFQLAYAILINIPWIAFVVRVSGDLVEFNGV